MCWAATAKLKKTIDIRDGNTVLSNEQMKALINNPHNKCGEFAKALEWLGSRDSVQALTDCANNQWKQWLIKKVPEIEVRSLYILEGQEVNITKGREYKYAIWSRYIWDCPEEYIDENTIKQFAS